MFAPSGDDKEGDDQDTPGARAALSVAIAPARAAQVPGANRVGPLTGTSLSLSNGIRQRSRDSTRPHRGRQRRSRDSTAADNGAAGPRKGPTRLTPGGGSTSEASAPSARGYTPPTPDASPEGANNRHPKVLTSPLMLPPPFVDTF